MRAARRQFPSRTLAGGRRCRMCCGGPITFPSSGRTSLSKVCLHLKQTLGIPVVLDLAALDRQNVRANDAVQLELDGVRLKTGLKLLLDQVDLTYRVVAEDNLLVITDRRVRRTRWTGSRTTSTRSIATCTTSEMPSTTSRTGAYAEEEAGPLVRKPTIIEEKPEANLADAWGSARGDEGPEAPRTESG